MIRSLAALKLRQVQYFLAVADALSFTRAAERVGATQSTLSHQVAELEEALGATLFDRAGKAVRLTEAGRLFQDYATRSVKQLEAGFVALSELEGLQRGTLRLGVIQSVSHTLLPPVLMEFMAAHPAMRVSVTERTAREVELGLAAGAFDLGIAFAPAVFEETELEPVLQEELLLVVGADHPLAGEPVVAMARLDGVRLALLDEGFSTRRLIDRYLERAGAQPDVVCTTNSMAIMLATVGEGGLATIIPESGLDRSRHTRLRSIHLRDPTPLRSSALLWPRYGFRTVAARAFAAIVRRHFGGVG